MVGSNGDDDGGHPADSRVDCVCQYLAQFFWSCQNRVKTKCGTSGIIVGKNARTVGGMSYNSEYSLYLHVDRQCKSTPKSGSAIVGPPRVMDVHRTSFFLLQSS